MRTRLVAGIVLIWACGAAAQAPLSAIDWLETRPAVPNTLTSPIAPVVAEPPVAAHANTPDIEVAPLGAPTISAVGLLPPQVTGLPVDLWRASAAVQLRARIARLDVSQNPPLTQLLTTLMLAEAEPPAAIGDQDAFLLERVRKLRDMGAVDAAVALLERAGLNTPAHFPVWFDLALLTNDTEAACRALLRAPHLSTDLAARVYCMARDGDWSTAVTLLQTAQALGSIDARMGTLLETFLDPELAEDLPALPPPSRPTALDFRLYEAVGERLATGPLPLRFAVTDLGGDSGWKAQLDAAERLARSGAFPANGLLGIYTARRAAASGGVWNRVAAVHALDTALGDRDPDAVAAALETVWPLMLEARLAAPLAQAFGTQLGAVPLTGSAANIASSLALLSESYERAGGNIPEQMPERALLAAVAAGQPPSRLPANTMYQAVAKGFGDPVLPARLTPLVERGRYGEAILHTLRLFETGAQGNPGDLTAALLGLRALGLEDTARRSALHLLLIELPL